MVLAAVCNFKFMNKLAASPDERAKLNAISIQHVHFPRRTICHQVANAFMNNLAGGGAFVFWILHVGGSAPTC